MPGSGSANIRVFGSLPFARSLYLVVALGMLANAAVALCIGVLDLLSPVTLSAQLIGLSYFIAGLVSVIGVYGVSQLFRKVLQRMVAATAPAEQALHLSLFGYLIGYRVWTQSFLKRLAKAEDDDYRRFLALVRDESTRPLEIIVSAAVAGLYIDWTLFYYSFHYIVFYAIISGILGLLYTCLAGLIVPAIWKDVSRGLKAFGFSLAAFGAVTQFWYQSVYVPENTATGMEYSFSIGSPVQSNLGKIVQVHVAMEDTGSVPNVVLASMVVATVTNYQKGDPRPKTTFLDNFRPISNDAFLFPDETYSFDHTETITEPGVNVLQFQLTVIFARTTWLTLGVPRTTKDQPCGPYSTQSVSDIGESHLRQFTQGNQVIFSDWCPWNTVSAGISGIRDGKLVPTYYPYPIGSDLGLRVSSRYYELVLS